MNDQTYEPFINPQMLLSFFHNLPVPIRITAHIQDDPDEPADRPFYTWEVLAARGSSEDLQRAVHDALFSMEQQLLAGTFF